jgi:hypothetical protein
LSGERIVEGDNALGASSAEEAAGSGSLTQFNLLNCCISPTQT